MNKKKEEMLNYLNELSKLAIMKLREHDGYESYEVVDVQYRGEIVCTNKETGEKVTLPRVDIIAADINDKKQTTKLTYIATEELDEKFLEKYEIEQPIKDKVGEKSEDDEEISLEELKKEQEKEENEAKEEEKEQEEEENKDEKDIDEEDGKRKKRKPSYVIERVNPDKAKMDYWKTVKQACGLPSKVDTLAFAYPVSSENKVDYADITVYMLDKDGYIIDDLNVDDYFEFDSSTGNNPIQDDVVRHEEDENKGTAQVEENRTMVRLYAKNSNDKNTYISLEQKNSFADYNDINAGRKTVAGTQNVEKQLETDRVRVWDSEREKLIRSNAGMFNMNEIFEEAEKHKEHGEEEYVHTENSDGKTETIEICNSDIIPGTDKTWEELSKETGEGIKKLQERFKREFGRDKSPENIVKEIIFDCKMTGHAIEHKHD